MIREYNKGSGQEIYEMWHRIFHDPAAYMEFYFDEIYPDNNVLVEEDERGHIRGMVHLNPYTLLIAGQSCPAHYIVGVATKEDCRRQGIMRQMVAAALSKLRDSGEMLTYLMPEDPRYYESLGFRYGADWIEAELLYEPDKEHPLQMTCNEKMTEKEHPLQMTCKEEMPEKGQAEIAAALECETLQKRYTLATASDARYLQCLEKEAKSEHDRIFYLYEGDKYAGRFVMGVVQDYMMLSRIACCTDERVSFLKEILKLCQNRYHYKSYHIVLDETWEEELKVLAGAKEIRLVSLKRKPMIMFRILDVEKLGSHLHAETDFELTLRILDKTLSGQDGVYKIESSKGRVSVAKTGQQEQGSPSQSNADESRDIDGGMITIEELTSILFGRTAVEEADAPSGLTKEGKKKLAYLSPMRDNSVMEYV